MRNFGDNKTGPFVLTPVQRRCLGAGFVLAALAIFFGAAALPFIHESWTIKYKFGSDRILLRTGQVLGASAGILMFFQFVLSSRLMLLDRIFAVNRLYKCHRISGIMIPLLAIFHASLILRSEGLVIIAPTIKNWPQYAGLLLLIVIGGLAFTSQWRKLIRLPYGIWRFFHTKTTHTAIAMLAIHVLFACDTFEFPPPRTWLFIALGIYVLLFIRVRAGRTFSRRLEVIEVAPVGKEAYAVRLRTLDGKRFHFVPGQFVFIRFKSKTVSSESHPFTISSPPLPDGTLEMTIRLCGDWTENIHGLKPGDGARIEGPYGLFGNTDLGDASRIIMIAGGIGITPMLSILGALAEKGDQRPVTLLWSNRTRAHVVHPERIAEYKKRLKDFRVVHIFTREAAEADGINCLGVSSLKQILSETSLQAKVLICGPAAMMTRVRKSLLSLGFSRRNVTMERFDL